MDAVLALLNFDQIYSLLSELFAHDLAKFTLVFFIAAKLHERGVKKEFALLRGSIDHVADVMGKRIDGLDARVGTLEKTKKR